jgi:hypothetical protein
VKSITHRRALRMAFQIQSGVFFMSILSSRSVRFGGRSTATVLLVFASAWSAARTSSQLSVGGAVQTPANYDLAALQALPSTTQTVSFLSGSTPQTHDYTGVSIWTLLNNAGIVTDPAVKNDVLNKYVVATGADGYRSVFSLGELNPSFGNRADLVAYAETVNGAKQPLGSDGFARTTAVGDVRGGRYVSNLVSLDVFDSGSTSAGTGGGVSGAFTVSGDVLHGASFDLAALQALPGRSVTVGADVFTGVSFWDLLNTTVGLATDPSVKNDVLGMVVVATGGDGYKSVFSLGELDPLFGNQPDLIAFGVDGSGLGSDGFARLVVPGDAKHGRYVSNLVSLEVFHAAVVPEPATCALMLFGLGFVGVLVRRAGPTSKRP